MQPYSECQTLAGRQMRRRSPSVRSADTTPPRRNRGMTLVEVVIALGLLALISGSVISVTFQIRSMAEQTVYSNSALTLAQGYMEQIRHLDYTTLKAVSQDSSSSVTLPINNSSGGAITPVSGTFFGNNVWSTETVYLDQSAAGTPIQPMTFKFRPILTSLETATTGLAAGVEVTVQYQITYNYGVTRTVNGALRSVRSSVPTY